MQKKRDFLTHQHPGAAFQTLGIDAQRDTNGLSPGTCLEHAHMRKATCAATGKRQPNPRPRLSQRIGTQHPAQHDCQQLPKRNKLGHTPHGCIVGTWRVVARGTRTTVLVHATLPANGAWMVVSARTCFAAAKFSMRPRCQQNQVLLEPLAHLHRALVIHVTKQTAESNCSTGECPYRPEAEIHL